VFWLDLRCTLSKGRSNLLQSTLHDGLDVANFIATGLERAVFQDLLMARLPPFPFESYECSLPIRANRSASGGQRMIGRADQDQAVGGG
jgi:hypothetical protein